jgi:two-component sensor histidine kinase
MPEKDNLQPHRARPAAPRPNNSEGEALLRQQRSLAQFGEKALTLDDLDFLLNESCRLVAEALGTDLAKIITVEDAEKSAFVRAGIGWSPGVVGQLSFPLEADDADRIAVVKREPVIVANVNDEKRFRIADFILKEGVQAFVNVPIFGADSIPTFGILEVDSKEPRRFTEDNVAFLKTYANMITAAVARQRTNEALRELADHRMHLLNELQHRLKNNLQSVSSFIRMALRDSDDDATKDVLEALLGRVDALTLVQQKIYASAKFDRVELAAYLGELSGGLLRFHQSEQNRIGLKSRLTSLTISPDIAVPLGLIVTEFITNSMKHAFDGEGMISLQLETVANEGRLVLADDGKGLGEKGPDGTGMKVIHGLANQLGAEIEWNGDPGTQLSVHFPIQKSK